MLRLLMMTLTVASLGGCASSPPSVIETPPERLSFDGTLDLSHPGIGFQLTHASGLSCDGRHNSGRLPDLVAVSLTCSDQQTGKLTVVKTDAIRGDVALSDGRTGDVVFDLPPKVAATTPPPIATATAAAVAPVIGSSPVVASPVRSHGTGYVRAHTRRGGYVRPHYRKGKYVSGHYRRGTTVRAHYRRR
jgi:hypothetical protein